MPKVSQEHLDARKEQIVTAAMICFAANGVHPTTIQDICHEAKLSAGAVYRYFKSKEEIVAAVAQAGREMIEETLAEARDAAEPGRMLEVVVTLFGGLFSPQHAFYRRFGGRVTPLMLRRMDVMLRAEALRNPEVMEILAVNYRRLQAQVTQIVAAAQAAGRIRADLSPAAIAQALNSHFIGLEAQLAYNPELDVEAYLHGVQALLLEGARSGSGQV